jgi:hypothetical protein
MMKQGEIFKETKERLSKRTGIKGKPFEKIKFAVVPRASFSTPKYLEDGKHLSSCFQTTCTTGERILTNMTRRHPLRHGGF